MLCEICGLWGGSLSDVIETGHHLACPSHPNYAARSDIEKVTLELEQRKDAVLAVLAKMEEGKFVSQATMQKTVTI